ncbi:UPF0146 family protein [Halorientalis salina]|uniref:UPF0146 family protein n=1 Tax=Halorientalis salina TaxID=2932266 RepID=UPI0010AC1DCC|nr:UPF0146 family protein [Halorientalis salina]
MPLSRRDTLVDYLAAFDALVEVGVGNRPDVAEALADRGCTVVATDIYDRPVPDGVRFVRDDVTDPDESVYADADAVYARNLPPELHRPTREVARRHDAAFCFTTLGGEQPLVPVHRETVVEGTLFVADGDRPA